MSTIKNNMPKLSWDFSARVIHNGLKKQYVSFDEAAHYARMLHFLAVGRAWHWLDQQVKTLGKQLDDYHIDVVNNFEAYREYERQGYSSDVSRIRLRMTKEQVEKPLEETSFPAGNYDQAESWWVLITAEEKDTGRPLTCKVSIGAKSIPEDDLFRFTDDKHYSDVDMLLHEFDVYFRESMAMQLEPFNREFADLPAKTQHAIEAMESQLHLQGNKLSPLQKRFKSVDRTLDDLAVSQKLFFYMTAAGFITLFITQGMTFWLMINRWGLNW